MSVSERDRLLELDVLRGLAALSVVLFHYTVRYRQLYGYSTVPDVVVPHGSLGVEFFFCISGFVIFMTLDRTRRPMDFVVSRVSRLWPAYIAAMAVTYTAVHLSHLLPGRETTFAQALINLTMFQEMMHVPHVDQAYWSLEVELIFYCWMFAAYLTGMLAHIRTLLWVALMPPLIYVTTHRFFHHDLSYLASTLLLVPYIPFFTIGIAAYNLRMKRAHPHQDLLLMVGAVVVTAVCLKSYECVTAIIAAVVFCAVAKGHLNWIARGPLIFLGTISYTLYLVHQNIGFIVIRAATHDGVPTDLAICMGIAVATGLATALTWTVEKPARVWLRDIYARYRKRHDVTPERQDTVTAG